MAPDTVTGGMEKMDDAKTQALLKTDRYMFLLLLAHVPVVGLLVPLGFGTMTFALIGALAVAALATIGYGLVRGSRAFSIVVGVCLMLFSAVMIQAQMGRIEMHFHIFAALAFTLIYKDWLPILAAAAAIALHHFLFTFLQNAGLSLGDMPIAIFNHGGNWGVTGIHAAFVIFEAAVLILIAAQQSRSQRAANSIIAAIHQFEQNKDLRVQIETDLDDEAVKSFNQMISGFGRLMAQLKQVVGAIAGSASSLATASEDTHRLIQGQSEQSTQSATAVHEMSATAQQIAQNAVEAARAAEEATVEASGGRDSVKDAMAATNAQNEILDSTASALNRLADVVQTIGETTSAIKGISQQTNLLALNAAIEAARAGEAGRGFSVVADEVRNLSVKTQASTEEIQKMIETLEAGTNEVVASMKQGQERSVKATQAVTASGEAIEQILGSIEKLQEMNDQIATAAEEQSAVSEEINQSMNIMSSQGESLAERAAEGSQTSVSVNRNLDELRTMIDAYKTS
ncbi:MAG: methyl-accepting chemotaxis protein [Oleiphilaceae bacterium]|nr:methyl-accepting chemotaxis protein [Oleiphilaceae bacterium]